MVGDDDGEVPPVPKVNMMFGSIIADFSINHKYDKTPQDFSQSVLLQKQSPRGRSSRAFV